MTTTCAHFKHLKLWRATPSLCSNFLIWTWRILLMKGFWSFWSSHFRMSWTSGSNKATGCVHIFTETHIITLIRAPRLPRVALHCERERECIEGGRSSLILWVIFNHPPCAGLIRTGCSSSKKYIFMKWDWVCMCNLPWCSWLRSITLWGYWG